jgi:hypothetical protein
LSIAPACYLFTTLGHLIPLTYIPPSQIRNDNQDLNHEKKDKTVMVNNSTPGFVNYKKVHSTRSPK